MEAYDYTAWLAHFREVYLGGHRSLLVVSPGQWGEMPQPQATTLEDASSLQALQPAYDIP